eukprot:6468261-Amphidinium_carterae.1
MQQVVARRPEFEGIELGLDGRTMKDMRTLANRNDHASRAVTLNARTVGKRKAPLLTLYDCPALEAQRKQAAVPAPRDDIPKCVRVLALDALFPSPLPCPEEASSGRTTDEVLFTDGSAASRETPLSSPTPCQDAGNPSTEQSSMLSWSHVSVCKDPEGSLRIVKGRR